MTDILVASISVKTDKSLCEGALRDYSKSILKNILINPWGKAMPIFIGSKQKFDRFTIFAENA